MIKVKRNTFPVFPGVAHAYPGDIVEWRMDGANILGLYKVNETGKSARRLYSITRKNQREDFKRPPIGVIAQNKSKGWVLELEEIIDGEEE